MGVNPRKAPFPWFGGKSKAAPVVWAALGDVDHYVEPFAGALGVLLNRPHPANRTYHSETINDLDGFVVNAWRAIQWSPLETAEAASWPVTEADKQARQIACLQWRTDRTLDLLAGDATWHDPLIAGWWLYGVCCQIGAFAGTGPWHADPVTGRITNQGRPPRVVTVDGPDREPGVSRDRPHLSNNGVGVNRPQLREPGVSRDLPHLSDDGRGVNTAAVREPGVSRDRPHLSNNGQGVNTAAVREPGVTRQRPHLSDDGRGVNHANLREPGVTRQRPHLNNNGVGVNHANLREPGVSRDLPHLSSNGQGVNRPQLREPGVADCDEFHPVTMPELVRWFHWLAARLRHVRIVNGDWTRVVTTGAAHTIPVRMGGHAGIFLDPPYDPAERAPDLYAHDISGLAEQVRAWCTANGDNPKNRIVLAGYDTEHDPLEDEGWSAVEWFTDGYLTGGMGNTNTANGHQQHRERLWLSPHCLSTTHDHQPALLFT